MSHRGQPNQYSPYYPYVDVEQAGSGAADAYHSNPYQPWGSYQNRLQQPAPQTAGGPPSYYGGQGHGTVNSVGVHSTYNARKEYKPDPPSVDAANLGNLAYASSLSRPTSSAQRSHPPESSRKYGSSVEASASGDDGRGKATGLGIDTARRTPISHAPFSPQAHTADAGHSKSLTAKQYSGTQALQQPNQQYSPLHQPSDQQETRGGHNLHPTNSQRPSHPNPSPILPLPQRTPIQSTPKQNPEAQPRQPHQTNGPKSSAVPILDDTNKPTRPPGSLPVQKENRPTGTASMPQHSDKSSTYDQGQGTNRPAYQANPHPNIDSQLQGQLKQQSAPVEEHYPTTVDPSQVFNDLEHQRRKDKELEKKQAAKSVHSVHTAPQADNHPLQLVQSEEAGLNTKTANASPDIAVTTSAPEGPKLGAPGTKEQMEYEMKQMIEKMRDYKAKDPSLFSQIWEQIKKGQAPQANSSKNATQHEITSPSAINGQLHSVMLNAHPTEPEPDRVSPFPPGFDRGRFPYQRRRRDPAISSSYKATKSHHKINQTLELPQDNPEPSVGSSASVLPVAQMISNNTDDTERRLREAMQAFHQSLLSPNAAPHTAHKKPQANSHTYKKPSEHLPTNASSLPVQNGMPVPPKGRTQWPDNKKWDLAKAAYVFLTTNPSNAGKQISIDEIHSILDQDPSYADMCETLRRRSFLVEPGHFARYLLNAVPDIGLPPATTTAPSSAPMPAASHRQYTGNYPPKPTQLPPSRFSKPSGYDSSKSPINLPISTLPQIHVSDKVSSSPSGVVRPLTKEDKARKRNLSDIVDLTQKFSDDEDLRRHHPKPRIEENPRPQSSDPANQTNKGKEKPVSAASQTQKWEGNRPTLTGRDSIFKELVAEPLNKRKDARRCSSYNPRTIARDILISSGKHPTMEPLNYHLEILREKFDHVNNDTDLSTFRWDIVDPVGKPSQKDVAPATLADIMNQNVDGDGGNLQGLQISFPDSLEKRAPSAQNSISKSSFNSSVTGELNGHRPSNKPRPGWKAASRHTLSASGPSISTFKVPLIAHGISSPSRYQLQQANPMGPQQWSMQAQNVRPDLSYQVNQSATFQPLRFTPMANSISPTAKTPKSPLVLASESTKSNGAHCIRCERQDGRCNGRKPCSRCRRAGIDASECVYKEDGQQYLLEKIQNSNTARDTTASPCQSSQLVGVIHGRKGRPPGAKNKGPRPDKGVPKGPKAKSILTPKKTKPHHVEQSPSTMSNEPRTNATSPSKSISVIVQQRSPSVKSSENNRHHYEEVDSSGITPRFYRPYKCNWDRCPAELHNLETLHKHILKHRKDLGTPIQCKMPGCGHVRDGDSQVTWLTFEDEETWDRHVERKHFPTMIKTRSEDRVG